MLHCNIDLNSIMWYERDGRVVGVLCDLDFAEDQGTSEYRHIRCACDNAAVVQPVAPKGNSAVQSTAMANLPAIAEGEATEQPHNMEGAGPSNMVSDPQVVVKPRYRMGTGPFMAMDLLRVGNPPIHKYRHDLESFFYGYIYFAATYNPDEQAFGYIERWQRASLVDIGCSKWHFLFEPLVRRDIAKAAHDTLKPLLAYEAPLMDLLYEFCDIETDWIKIANLANNPRKAERNRAKIEALEKERDAKMSFSKFMAILGVPEEESIET